MSKKFQVIVADPPWGAFKDKLNMSVVKRGAQANYRTMTNEEIEQLPIEDIIDPDGAILCLWVPSSLLQEGLDVMDCWGFTHKQTYVWVKTKKEPLKTVVSKAIKLTKTAINILMPNKLIRKTIIDIIKDYNIGDILAFGMGRLFRQTHEICLIGTSNNKIYQQLQNRSQRSVCFAPNLKHSAKPEALQDALDIMFPGTKKIELFARRERAGWTTLGNECPSSLGEDIKDSIAKLV
jgi:N6-adenosine-specific RNA methylase IME4